ncbi:MAG: CvpA family protein [Bacteroidales bacterium]|jgi:membrane protein required for colicin V production|nr:CvpA family protein [Bacteroidales bacterium]
MNTLDLIILFPVAIGMITGLFRGLIKEVIALAILIIGIYLAKLLAPLASSMLIDLFDISAKGAQPLGFIAVFSIVAISLTIAGHLMQGAIKMLSLGFLNSIVGGIFGGLKVALLISVIFNVLQGLDHRLSVIDPELKEKSIFYDPVKGLAPELWNELMVDDDNVKTEAYKKSA